MIRGHILPSHLTATYSTALRPTSESLEALIEGEWQRQTTLGRKEGRSLFDGKLLRLVDYEISGDPGLPEVSLTLGPTGYREFVGTNLAHDKLPEKFPWEYFANPVGTSALVLTGDHKIALGRRSEQVFYHSGHVHAFGGILEDSDRGENNRVHVFESIRRELREELSVGEDQIENLWCSGLVRDYTIHQPELLFEVQTTLSFDDLKRRWKGASSRGEHADLVAVDDQSWAVRKLLSSRELIAPVAVAALEFHLG